MDSQPVSSEPKYDHNAIHCDGVVYSVQLESAYEESYTENRAVALDLEPGEVPRRVMDGFAYGGRVFLPPHKNHSRRVDMDEKAHGQAMLALDTARRRETAQARSIPVELHAEVCERSRTQSERSIALWLNQEKGCRTSYGSVGRLIRQLKSKEARASQRAVLEAEVAGLRIQLNQTFDTMMDLQADILEEHDEARRRPADPKAKPAPVPVVWRVHHQSASLLERRLRVLERELAPLLREVSEAKPEPAPKPASEAKPEPAPKPVEPPKPKPVEVTIEMAIDRPYGPERGSIRLDQGS